MPDLTPDQAIRLLAALMVTLALGCLGLAVAYAAEHERAACWRAAYEDGEIPPEGVC